MYGTARCLLFKLDPEIAHQLSIAALRTGFPLPARQVPSMRLQIRVAGLDFPNPIGMAAGYDKNAEVPDALLKIGFGFVEVGTVTPLPQDGNPRPRLFRLPDDQAVINRMGFNNEGHSAIRARLMRRRGKGIVGVNLGANRGSADRIADYVFGIESFAGLAAYFAINISSPNTPGLRDLQTREHLAELLARCVSARNMAAPRVPLFLKLAPDLCDPDLDDIAEALESCPIEGVIISNTTLDRSGLSDREHLSEPGGLSGVPLFARSTIILARLRRRLGTNIALIGTGGVNSVETALEKIRAGADLVQIYTGMVYEGPALPGRIITGLDQYAEREGLKSIREIRDSRLDTWATRSVFT